MHETEGVVLVGQSPLVCPVTEDDVDTVDVVKPPGRWYRYPSGAELDEVTVAVDLSTVPVYVRGWRIFPTFSTVAKSALQTVTRPITLYVALDESWSADGELCLDDGVSFNYAKGEFVRVTFSYRDGKLTSSGSSGTAPASLIGSIAEKAVVFGAGTRTVAVDKRLCENFDIAA